ncbi:MAG: ArdC-like ssDNA-binding domain-containing protein [Christensenella sp.]
MENYDVLMEKTNQVQEDHFDKEAWVESKKQEREKAYAQIDDMTEKVFSNPAVFNQYLNMQANMGKMRAANTLLVMEQKPNATYVKTFDEWKERGRSVKKNQTGIRVLEANGEYMRDDGSVAMGYDVARVFDISQTHGKVIPQRATNSMPLKSKLKALMTGTSVPVKLSDSVSQEVGAQYSQDTEVVEVARGLDGDKLFYCIARELARADEGLNLDTFGCHNAAAIACKRFGIAAPAIDKLPELFGEMEPQEKRAVLNDIREAACDTVERVDNTLYAELRKQKTQPAR